MSLCVTYHIIISDILWKKDDPHVLYSCSRDQCLFQHVFIDASRPANNLVPAGIDMDVNGHVSMAIWEKPDKSSIYI